MYERTFTVEGDGEFPAELLTSQDTASEGYRFSENPDRPRTQVDTGKRRVDVVVRSSSVKDLEPDVAAWKAAGWTVVG